MAVRVVSFNLLVPIYATSESYFKCQPQFLDTDYRWNLIQNEFIREITHHDNTIICLQEISLTILPKLQLFFHQQNYVLYSDLYGNRHNDYMGVGIAIPTSMQLNSISYIKVGDYLRSVTKLRETQSNLVTWVQNLWWQFVWSRFTKPIVDPWKISIDRNNTLICLQVTIKNKPLCIGTYHMPCVFKIQDVMMIHSSVVKDLMFKLAAGQNLILAGDFNTKPSEVSYRAITRKGYVGNDFPASDNYDVFYRPNTEQVLKSAYREKNGTEPIYTNHVDTISASKFQATLDYIFFNGSLEVEKVLELPDQPTSESYPDETHPSDHLMIAASFQLL
ncbi:hypothetical protein I4U23_000685 [Adineta vaga]|nr:hypothetical protein I4U23_000685 [Adineta vaga]